ncbi:MAG: radical SAM family heme chaperone HemW [Gammaproteobacteria bacterium]|nr:radical SAM family heme chaperone HemW [Gammaproteobacteria bacterium]
MGASIPTLGIYVHFPWCVHKCPYCDFNSHPLKDGLQEQPYTQALLADIDGSRELLASRNITSVFFGGGTPSLFSPQSFRQVLSALGVTNCGPQPEITIEANPGTREYHGFEGYRSVGINRLSLGAQSFSDKALKRLGRIHCADETLRAFADARVAGFDNINLDIIYGLPEQTPAETLDDLGKAIELGPEHISWYELTLEPKTEFHRRPPVLPAEDSMLEMESAGRALLQAAGYVRYEVSAWAKPDHQSAHNLNYWLFGDYAGFGAGAHGKISDSAGVRRTARASQPRLYMNDPAHQVVTELDASRLRFEFLLNALRLPDGVPFVDLSKATGLDTAVLEPEWSQGVARGLLRKDRIATTALGFVYLDGVLQSFL